MELGELNSTEVLWNQAPNFVFDTEVDALIALDDLGDQLRAAREQVDQTMRYLRAAVRAADEVVEDDGPIAFQALVNHSGLARQTVKDMLRPRRHWIVRGRSL